MTADETTLKKARDALRDAVENLVRVVSSPDQASFEAAIEKLEAARRGLNEVTWAYLKTPSPGRCA